MIKDNIIINRGNRYVEEWQIAHGHEVDGPAMFEAYMQGAMDMLEDPTGGALFHVLTKGVEMAKNDLRWHYTKDDDYPSVLRAENGQVPCLVLHNGTYGVRYWNTECKAWDDEEGDDVFCEKDKVEKWLYLDTLLRDG